MRATAGMGKGPVLQFKSPQERWPIKSVNSERVRNVHLNKKL